MKHGIKPVYTAERRDLYSASAIRKGVFYYELFADRKSWRQRDSGFQIFYVFINIGGLVAPFIAPLLRSWWLSAHDMVYNARLPALCHDYIAKGAEGMSAEAMGNLNQLMSQCVGETTDMAASCAQYLQIFNEGIHYSFVASVAAMLISLIIFFVTKSQFPNPGKKEAAAAVTYSAEEKAARAMEF